MLLNDKFSEGVGKGGHIPDALLVMDGKQIAIEVELTCKSHRRLENILKSYATNFAIQEVWYFCSDEAFPAVNKLANYYPYLKVYKLKDFLEENLNRQKECC